MMGERVTGLLGAGLFRADWNNRRAMDGEGDNQNL
jgi:hypothetical protein